MANTGGSKNSLSKGIEKAPSNKLLKVNYDDLRKFLSYKQQQPVVIRP
jgi:hypothetical protein